MIVSKAEVYFRSGRGGEGSASFISRSNRKLIASGGDGGDGGDVRLQISSHLYDLRRFQGKKKFIAESGQNGNSNHKKGADAPDLVVKVPLGTRVLDEDSNLIADLIKPDDDFMICKGGFGGKGNFKRNHTIPAKEGQEKEAILDYCIVNDLAIVGFPNSGKTSLFNLLCNQKAKVAEYPFTTVQCHWAPCDHSFKRFIVLDTPPLKKRKKPDQIIEAGSLKHLLRSKMILFLSDDQDDFDRLKQEISLYDPELLKKKKFFYLLDKVDKIDVDKLKTEILKDLK